jgi:hypothetical protein
MEEEEVIADAGDPDTEEKLRDFSAEREVDCQERLLVAAFI